MRCLIAIAALVFLAPTAEAAGRLRLVLDNGWVVPLTGDGSRLAGEPQELELTPHSNGLEAVVVDFRADRLYVTPRANLEELGVAVFELSTLRRIGFLPKVTKVILPANPDVPVMVTHALLPPAGGQAASISSPNAYAALAGTQLQRRARKHPETVLGVGEDRGLVARCAGQNGYLAALPGGSFDTRFVIHESAEASTAEARHRAFEDGLIVDCWADGSALRLRPADGLRATPRVARRDRGGDEVTIAVQGRWSIDMQDARVWTLDDDGRYAAYLGAGTDFRLFDFSSRTQTGLPMRGNAVFAQRSRDGKEWYLPTAVWTFKDAEFMTAQSIEGDYAFNASVYRLSLTPTPHAQALQLPREIAEVHDREVLTQEIEGESEETRAQRLALLPAPGALARRMDRVGIVAVIAE